MKGIIFKNKIYWGLLISLSLVAGPLQADNHSESEASQQAVAPLLTFCTLNDGKKMQDAEALGPMWGEFFEEQGMQQLLNRVKEILLNRTPVSKKSVIPINNNKNIMQEIIRGIIINHTHNELPYDTAVLINKIDEKKSLTSLYASIYVSKENQKKIVIGKGGMMIKKIGTESRLILEKSYDKKFFISLNVLVKDNWKNNYSLLKELGYID